MVKIRVNIPADKMNNKKTEQLQRQWGFKRKREL